MLARSQRLSTEQLEVVMEKGRAVHSPLFLFRIMKVPGKSRVAAVVPKKIAKTAVKRNNGRRRIYEAVRSFYSSMHEGFQVVIFAKVPALEAKHEMLISDLKDIFVKSGLLK